MDRQKNNLISGAKDYRNNAEALDPDVRFLLANERTLLAWIRTSLSIMAIGLALTQLGDKTTSQVILGLFAVCSGAGMTLLGYVRYKAADTAIRKNQLPFHGHGPRIQVFAIILFAVVVLIVEIPVLF